MIWIESKKKEQRTKGEISMVPWEKKHGYWKKNGDKLKWRKTQGR